MTPIVVKIPSDPDSKEPLVWIAVIKNECVGHVRLSISSDKIKYHNAWVHPNHRRKGIYTLLWETRDKFVKQNFIGKISYAWCKSGSLPLYIKKGYTQGETCTYVEKVIEP